jgi:DnaJ-domain-containing protein 1
MNTRPYPRSTIVELEDLFAAKRTDTDTLIALIAEWQFRNVPRATSLLTKVKVAHPAGQATELPVVVLPNPAYKLLENIAESPSMVADEACKALRVVDGATWVEIEQARAKIVQRSHPDALEGLNPNKRANILAEARIANAAYLVLLQARKAWTALAVAETAPATTTRDLAGLVEVGALTRSGELKHTRYMLNIPLSNIPEISIDEHGKPCSTRHRR